MSNLNRGVARTVESLARGVTFMWELLEYASNMKNVDHFTFILIYGKKGNSAWQV